MPPGGRTRRAGISRDATRRFWVFGPKLESPFVKPDPYALPPMLFTTHMLFIAKSWIRGCDSESSSCREKSMFRLMAPSP